MVIYLHLLLRPDISGTSVEMYHMCVCLRWEEAKFPRYASGESVDKRRGTEKKKKRKKRMETSLTASAGASSVYFETRGRRSNSATVRRRGVEVPPETHREERSGQGT